MLTVLPSDTGDERARHAGNPSVGQRPERAGQGSLRALARRHERQRLASCVPMDPIARRLRCRPTRRATNGRRASGGGNASGRSARSTISSRRRIHRSPSGRPRPAARAGCRCLPSSPIGCGRSQTGRGSTVPRQARCRPRHQLRRASHVARRRSCRCTTAGSCVIPTLASGAVRQAGERAAPGDRARRDRARQFATATAAGDRATCSAPPASRPSRSRPLPVPAAATEPPDPRARRAIRSSLSIGTLERRKNLPVLVEAFGLLAAEHDEVCSGARGRRRRRSTGRSTRPSTGSTAAARAPGRHDRPTSTRPALSWLLHNADGAGLPVARRGVRLPAARCDAGRRADRGQQPRQHPRGRAVTRRCCATGGRGRSRRGPRRGARSTSACGPRCLPRPANNWRRSRGTAARPTWRRSTDRSGRTRHGR